MPRTPENTRDLHEDLKNYRRYIKRLEKVESRLAEMNDVILVQASVPETFHKKMRRVYGLPPTDKARRLKAERKRLWTVTSMVELYVSTIEDRRTREIFRRHFIGGETYAAIAESLGLSPESVRKVVQRKLKSP